MTLHFSTRVPVNDEYAALVGKAIYVFAYYEWTIIYIIEKLLSGFVHKYSRGNPMTSGSVKKEFQSTINTFARSSLDKKLCSELQECCDMFEKLITKRNALIHAHPCTDGDGSQILSYQTNTTKSLPDMKWPSSEVEAVIKEFDAAACSAADLLDKLR